MTEPVQQRTSKKDDVECYLKEAGFKRIETVEIVQQAYHAYDSYSRKLI